MARGTGVGRLLEGGDYFKYFRQRGVIIRGGQLIEGRLLFEEIRYFEIWDELSVHDRVIFKGQQWIIPQTLRQKIKQKLHDFRIGSQGCLCRARETVYWPGANAKITDYIQKCKVCMSLQSNQTKEPLICHKPTSRPWEKFATDIFTLDNKNCLCTVNYYPGYFELDQLHSKTVTVIIKKLKRHFVTHGTPNELLSGNEPPFNSAEFEYFLWSSGTEHVTSSPGYPQSNGRVENAVNSKDISQQRVSHSQQCQLRETSLNGQPKPLLQYLARPTLCVQRLTSLS